MLYALNTKETLQGIVLDENKQPIPGLNVKLNPDKKYTQTDSKGNFKIENLYQGNYQIIISGVGYKTYQTEINITKGNNFLNIKMEVDENILQEIKVIDKKNAAEDNLLNIQKSAMPVTVITKETIQLMGSRRLDEILKEQTGLAIVNDISSGARASGIQMQGFGSQYIMVLIDGQPMVGRNNGNFDLSRISVNNIERIEIIKGASSCLFGSEAMGGAINIVTQHGAVNPQAFASIKYGSLNITDVVLEGETPFASQRGSANLAFNYYKTDGFNTDPQYVKEGTTTPPYQNLSFQGRGRYQIAKNSFLSLSGRYGYRKSDMNKDFGLSNVSGDNQKEHDVNLSLNFNQHLSSKVQTITKYYNTFYQTDINVIWQQSNTLAQSDVFKQSQHLFEQQLAYQYQNNLKFTSGVGFGIESMSNQHFTKNPGNQTSFFGYTQANWNPTKKLESIIGLRFDQYQNYGNSLNPSLGLQYSVNSKLALKVSTGTGFKAPDFKNRFLTFYNPAANYQVIGTEIIKETLADLESKGQISEIRQPLLNQLANNLKAEQSISLNTGITYTPRNQLKLDFSVFYHTIKNQINSVQIATGTNNLFIYTFQNLPKAINKGLESSISYFPKENIEINLGYQYLIAKDLSVIDSIKANVKPYAFIRNLETGESRASKPSDYWGLENRSRHMANFRVFYKNKPTNINANLRINYRGKFPFGDANNNGYIDRYDTFVDGYFLVNASIEKKIMNQKLSIQLSAENIFDYVDRLMPAQVGRVFLVGLNYRFFK